MNTYLLSAFAATVATPLGEATIPIGAKPALLPRARELGRALQSEYGLIALCEVFSEPVRSRVLEAWDALGPRAIETGPGAIHGGERAVIGSGLLTISPELAIVRSDSRVFREQGDPLVDTDVHANKGVLLTELDLGLGGGNIDLYSTHLLSGKDLDLSALVQGIPGAAAGVVFPRRMAALRRRVDRALQDERVNRDRLRQVQEIIDFIRDSHDPENVAIVVGDLNVKADDPDMPAHRQPYHTMRRLFAQVEMVDLWDRRPWSSGKTANFEARRSEICTLDSGESPFCLEENQRGIDFAGLPGERLDYIFVERPRPHHRVRVDLGCPRRRPFLRSRRAEGFDEIEVLSDHLALDTTLVVSAR